MAKGVMYIDGQRVPFDGEKNVLAVIRKAGIDMPTFCYYSEEEPAEAGDWWYMNDGKPRMW